MSNYAFQPRDDDLGAWVAYVRAWPSRRASRCFLAGAGEEEVHDVRTFGAAPGVSVRAEEGTT